ncbi:MAG: SH3 domain-containing protein [Clostridiales bacterium]|nr:SH3 domain-containing protein [Clostridiales bacterium]
MRKIILLMFVLVLVSCNADINKGFNVTSRSDFEVAEQDASDPEVETLDDMDVNGNKNDNVTSDDSVQESRTESTSNPHFRVLCESLNVRNEPIENSEIIGKLREDYIGEVLEVKYDSQGRVWYYDKEAEGWIAGWYCREIEVSKSQSVDDYASVEITKESADLYTDVTTEDKTDIQVYRGEKYRVIDSYFDESDEAWYKIVSKNGTIGWIRSQVGNEYLSSKFKILDAISSFEAKLEMEHYDTPLQYRYNLMLEVEGSSKGYMFDSDNYQVFNILVDDMSYVFIYSKLDNVCKLLTVSDAFTPITIAKENYLLSYSIVDNQTVVMVHNLKVANESSMIAETVLNVFDIGLDGYFAFESDSEYVLIHHLIDGLESISYYDLINNKLIPFKQPIEGFEWKIAQNEHYLEIIRKNSATLEERVYARSLLRYWNFEVTEDKKYLVEGEYEKILNLSIEDYSDEGITSHVKKLGSHFLSLNVYEYDRFQTDEYNFYIISEYEESEIDTHVTASYVLKWRRGTDNYELINRCDLVDYLNKADYSMTSDLISQFIEESKLYSDEYSGTSYEHEGMYVFSIGLPSCDGGNYQNLVVWDYKNKKAAVRLSETVFGIDEVIENRYMLSSIFDGMNANLYINDLYGDDVDDEILSVYYNQYKQIPNTSWIIIEHVYPHEEGYYSHPPITDIELFNYETQERKLYLRHDELNDYVFDYNNEIDELSIYKKMRGKKLHEGNEMITEVIDCNDSDQVEEFLLKFMELPNMSN